MDGACERPLEAGRTTLRAGMTALGAGMTARREDDASLDHFISKVDFRRKGHFIHKDNFIRKALNLRLH